MTRAGRYERDDSILLGQNLEQDQLILIVENWWTGRIQGRNGAFQSEAASTWITFCMHIAYSLIATKEQRMRVYQ